MASKASISSKIQPVLLQLPLQSRLALRQAVDRARQQGIADPLYDMLDDALAGIGIASSARRQPNPSRFFFQPVQDFLISEKPHEKTSGRIWRGALQTIWNWIENTAAQDEVRAFRQILIAEINNPVFDDEAAGNTFIENVLPLIEERLETAYQTPETKRRFCYALGGEQRLHELEDILCLLRHRDIVSSFSSVFPENASPQNPEHVSIIANFYKEIALLNARLPYYATVIFQRCMQEDTQLPVWAVACAGNDTVSEIANSPFASLIDIALSDCVLMADLCSAEVKKPCAGNKAFFYANRYALNCRNLRLAADLDGQSSDWLRRLSEARLRVSNALNDELSQIFHLMRRNVKPLRSFGAQNPYPPDEFDLTRLCFLIELMVLARHYIEEFALNEAITRIYTECSNYLSTAISSLQDESRHHHGNKRLIVMAYSDAALRVSMAWYGDEHTELLKRGFDLATSDMAAAPAALSKQV